MADGREGTGTRARAEASVEAAVLAIALSALLSRRRPRASAADPGRLPIADDGHAARDGSLFAVPRGRWWPILRRVYDEIDRDRILAVAAGVTFYGLLAVFPAVAAFVSIFGLVADPASIARDLAELADLLPGGAIDIIGGEVQRLTANGSGQLGFALVAGIGMSLWSANAGVKAVFDALNVAYGETERRNFVVLNLWSLAFTAGAILFLALALSGVVVVPVVLGFVGLGGAADRLISLARWPALLAVVMLALSVLYRFGPSRERPRWRWITPGSLLAAVGWLAFSMLFSWYVSRFGNYNATYGSLGAAIGFLTWMWLSATIVLIGAEVNAEIEREIGEGSKAPASGPARDAEPPRLGRVSVANIR